MLIEVKAKVAYIIDGKVRKKQETFIIDKEFFAEAEYAVLNILSTWQSEGTVDASEIVSLRWSVVKEIITQYEGESTFVASLRDTFLQDDGSEKVMRYKVLLWANNISEAMTHTREIAQQGYDMQIDGLKEVSYIYLNQEEDEQQVSEDQLTGGA